MHINMKSVNRLLVSLLLTFPLTNCAIARDGTPLIRDFSSSGSNKRVHVELRDFQDVTTISDTQLAALKEFVADAMVESWEAYEREGFKSPATETDTDGTEIIRTFYRYKPEGRGGRAPPTGFFELNGQGVITGFSGITLRATVAHELFHKIQHSHSELWFRYPASFYEGTATLAAPLVISELDELQATGTSCESNYLKYPGWTLWFRPNVDDLTNVCNTSIWWKYLTQQFSTKAETDYQSGIDTLRRLLVSLESSTGWRQRALDNIISAGDFSGDYLDDLLLKSDYYVGIVSPTFRTPTTHDVVAQGNRFGGQWRFFASDRLSESCDIIGDDRHEFLVRSNSHLGIIGLSDSEDFVTVDSIQYGQELGGGGWRVATEDSIVLLGDLDGDKYCEFLIKSPTHIGLVEYANGSFQTLAVHLMDSYIGGWRIKQNDQFLALGDFNGDGANDFVIRSATHIGFASFSSAEKKLQTYAVFQHNSSPRVRGKFLSQAQLLGAGRFGSASHDSLLVLSDGGAYALSVGRDGNLRTDVSTESSLASADSEFVAITDLDGNGSHEIIRKQANGTLSAMSVSTGNLFTNIATLAANSVVSDGYPESRNRPRRKWTVSNRYEVLGHGDFDGNGRNDLLLRDGSSIVVLRLKTDSSFAIGEIVDDDARFDGLLSRTNEFIQRESRGSRTLHSMFTDFGIANYVSSLRGDSVTGKYRYKDENLYPGSSDYDKNPATPPLVLTEDITINDSGGVISHSQDPWTTKYFRFNTSAQALELTIQSVSPDTNKAYNAIKISRNRVTSIQPVFMTHPSVIFESTSPEDYIILVVSSYETPLSYNIASSAR